MVVFVSKTKAPMFGAKKIVSFDEAESLSEIDNETVSAVVVDLAGLDVGNMSRAESRIFGAIRKKFEGEDFPVIFLNALIEERLTENSNMVVYRCYYMADWPNSVFCRNRFDTAAFLAAYKK